MHKQHLKTIAERFGVDLLYVFGSAARGDFRANSDIDIAYHARKPLTAKRALELATTLRKIFGGSRDVDLVSLASAPPLLRYAISQEGIKLYGTPSADDAYFRSSVKQFIDAKPLFEATRSYVRERRPV